MLYNSTMLSNNKLSPIYLSITAVLFRSDSVNVQRFRDCLIESIHQLRHTLPVARITLAIVDNAAGEDGDCFSHLFTKLHGVDALRFVQAETNLGYGRAHNMCMNQGGDFHLILNPDVYLAPDALIAGISYMQAHPEAGMVTPYGVNDHNEPLFLSKRYPTVLDFLLRGFAPVWLHRLFAKRLAHYEMHSEYLSALPSNQVEIASGCCMLLRTELLQKLNGFCEDYFLYFEDFDLSVRLRQHALIVFVPQMKIIHDGGHAARKGWWHIQQFAKSGSAFFSTHGWRWL
jgi:GT2 family glycosyltransferase